VTATDQRTRRWAVTEPPPHSVRTATNILYVLIGLGLLSPIAFLAVTALSLARGNPFNRELVPVSVMAVGTVAIGWFFLMLIKKTRKGRRWAWMTLLMMLGLIAVMGFLVMTAVSDGAAIGIVIMAVPLILMVLLAGPRQARAHFARTTRKGVGG
jgi:FtsH-binding integral membrane protein